jgi:glycosyltransferase involved in cell wall biosynthesis
MATKQILFLRGFREAESTSTTLHADGLISALQKCPATEFLGNEFAPEMLLPSWLRGKWGMRFARYCLYPFQVPPYQTDTVTHLLDHSYAHLFYTRNTNKTIVTVTDLIPVLWWKGLLPVLSKKGIPITVLYSLYALKRATHIVTISSNTKNDLVKLIGCDPSKISVVYLGIDSIFKPYDTELKNTIRDHLFGSESKKIILITGSQFYKNHETALKTVASLLTNGLKNIYLVKTGNPTQDWLNLVKKYDLEKNVINIGFIPREQMPDLYNAVDVLLFPSLYEGFGWPPLEAMACGTPVVSSNAASLPEVIGEAGIMHEPYDYVGFAATIKKLFFDDEYYRYFVKQGLKQAKRFNWEETARQVFAIYENVLNTNS